MLKNMTPDFVDTPQKYIDACGADYVENDWDEFDDEQIELLKKCVNDKYMDVYEHVVYNLLDDADYDLVCVHDGVLDICIPKKHLDINVMYGASYGYQVYGEYGAIDINGTAPATGDVTNDTIAILNLINGGN